MSEWTGGLACVLALGLLAGCGQKGALYLPDRAGSVINRPGEIYPPRTAAPQPAPAPAPAAPAPSPDHSKDSKQDDDSQPQ